MLSGLRSLFHKSPLYPHYERLVFWWRLRNHQEVLQWQGTETRVWARCRGHLVAAKNFLRIEQSMLQALEKHLSKDGVFWDIGANLGLFSLLLSHRCRQVHAFEPEKVNYLTLQKNLELNQATNITAHQLALFSENRMMTLHLSADLSMTGMHSLLNRNAGQGQKTHQQEVECLRGDDLLNRQNLEIPQVIKIDVEGAEFEVLAGMPQILSSPQCKAISVELHPIALQRTPEQATEDLVAVLEPHGLTEESRHVRGDQVHCFFIRK